MPVPASRTRRPVSISAVMAKPKSPQAPSAPVLDATPDCEVATSSHSAPVRAPSARTHIRSAASALSRRRSFPVRRLTRGRAGGAEQQTADPSSENHGSGFHDHAAHAPRPYAPRMAETLARVSIVGTPGKQGSLPGRSPALRLTGEASMTITAASTKQELPLRQSGLTRTSGRDQTGTASRCERSLAFEGIYDFVPAKGAPRGRSGLSVASFHRADVRRNQSCRTPSGVWRPAHARGATARVGPMQITGISCLRRPSLHRQGRRFRAGSTAK